MLSFFLLAGCDVAKFTGYLKINEPLKFTNSSQVEEVAPGRYYEAPLSLKKIKGQKALLAELQVGEGSSQKKVSFLFDKKLETDRRPRILKSTEIGQPWDIEYRAWLSIYEGEEKKEYASCSARTCVDQYIETTEEWGVYVRFLDPTTQAELGTYAGRMIFTRDEPIGE